MVGLIWLLGHGSQNRNTKKSIKPNLCVSVQNKSQSNWTTIYWDKYSCTSFVFNVRIHGTKFHIICLLTHQYLFFSYVNPRITGHFFSSSAPHFLWCCGGMRHCWCLHLVSQQTEHGFETWSKAAPVISGSSPGSTTLNDHLAQIWKIRQR